ncbi:hypothetical protein PSYPI_10752, partial [Pseudomonas syringae pv. pisi str. 1704B]
MSWVFKGCECGDDLFDLSARHVQVGHHAQPRRGR